MTGKANRPDSAAELRKRAERKARQNSAPGKGNTTALSPEESGRILQELRVHQIELEMQNEELRSTQVELNASRARYFDLYDLAPVGYCSLSDKGLILEANLTAATLLGVARGAMVKQPISRFILTENQDIYYLHRKQLFKTGDPQAYELQMVRANSQPFWARLDAAVAQDEKGTTVCRVVFSDITELKRAEEKIITLLHEKELLLKETHHRIKNNMSNILSLLSIQASSQKNPTVIEKLKETASRIRSMMILYDKLYCSDSFNKLSIKAFLPPLVNEIVEVFRNRIDVRTSVQVEDFDLSSKILSPIGIIINELVTNSIKHAFTGIEKGKISVSASKSGSMITLVYEDNGVGLPETVSFENSCGFGMQLIGMLVQQIKGSIRVERNRGTIFVIELKV